MVSGAEGSVRGARARAADRDRRAARRRLQHRGARAHRVAEAFALPHLPRHAVQQQQAAAQNARGRRVPDEGSAQAAGRGPLFRDRSPWVWIGGGMWRPEPPELVRLRAHIAETWPEIRDITRAAAFRRRFDGLSGDTMTRVPRGYPSNHPAAAFLKHRQFYGGAEFPAS